MNVTSLFTQLWLRCSAEDFRVNLAVSLLALNNEAQIYCWLRATCCHLCLLLLTAPGLVFLQLRQVAALVPDAQGIGLPLLVTIDSDLCERELIRLWQ